MSLRMLRSSASQFAELAEQLERGEIAVDDVTELAQRVWFICYGQYQTALSNLAGAEAIARARTSETRPRKVRGEPDQPTADPRQLDMYDDNGPKGAA